MRRRNRQPYWARKGVWAAVSLTSRHGKAYRLSRRYQLDKSLNLSMTGVAEMGTAGARQIDGLKLAGVISDHPPTLGAPVSIARCLFEAVVEKSESQKRYWRVSRKCARKPCWPQYIYHPDWRNWQSAWNVRKTFAECTSSAVHRMPLVEIIRGEKSSDETIAKSSHRQKQNGQDADCSRRLPRLLC
ncbi:hypothetical protein KCP77_01015 [Salmonella enterica subsp. enterica]|nr:hypothetical protein KCP77_01015 [Salmonella enterica subsp. enterica]